MGRERQQEDIQFTREVPVKDLTPKIVENLMDILAKWGKVTADDAMVCFQSGPLVTGVEIWISASSDPQKKDIFVAKSLTPAPLIIETNQGIIFWDRDLKSYEAELAIALIDERAKKTGFVDEPGNRIPLKPEQSFAIPGKYKVDEVFAQKGAAFMVLPGKDPSKFLKQFDKPEELYVEESPLGGASILAKKDREYHQKRREVALEVLKKIGFNTANLAEIAGQLSFEEVLEIREEIERRLKEQS